MPQSNVFGKSWQGSLGDLAQIILQVRQSRAFGRLSLRNSERLSVIHLYFRAGKLMHHVSNRSDIRSTLVDLQEWTRGFARFDRGVTTNEVTLNDEHEQLLDQTLLYMCRRGVVVMPQASQAPHVSQTPHVSQSPHVSQAPRVSQVPHVSQSPRVSPVSPEPHVSPMSQGPRVIEGNLIASGRARQLISPLEWQVLVEATRRVSVVVARLVGPQEAFSVLQDILDDCSSAFPAFASLKIAPGGYLQITDRSQLNTMSRKDLLEGFTALIATCQIFCSPLIGDREAHNLIVRAVQEIGPSLAHLGVMSMDGNKFSETNY